jgi:hypothetical protein
MVASRLLKQHRYRPWLEFGQRTSDYDGSRKGRHCDGMQGHFNYSTLHDNRDRRSEGTVLGQWQLADIPDCCQPAPARGSCSGEIASGWKAVEPVCSLLLARCQVSESWQISATCA